jgi:two-component system sensor histidine kinase RpfC
MIRWPRLVVRDRIVGARPDESTTDQIPGPQGPGTDALKAPSAPAAHVAPALHTALAAQAKLRMIIGIPMTGVLVWLHYYADRALLWAEWAIVCYFVYIAATSVASRRLPERYWTAAIYCTAALDAVFLIFWLPLLENAAGIVLAFALFTGLGYGLRTGDKYVMAVNQLVTLTGYALILVIYPQWMQNPVRAISFAVPLVIVPIYVGMLLDQLHAARQRAEEESQAKSDMLAKVSHELRTPLGGIVSAADLIHMAAPTAPEGRLASTIMALAKHLQDDIADLLDQAKHSKPSR